MRNNKKRYVGKITRSQRGVALITVLLIFSISTLIASKIIINKVIDVKRTTGLLNRTQAYYYALAAEELAILALKNDYEEDLIPNQKILLTLIILMKTGQWDLIHMRLIILVQLMLR